jgi:YD repeat-containing protein
MELSSGYTYDTLNRLKEVAQPGSIITRYAYDNHGNPITVTDANNNVTTFLYDDMGRAVVTTTPDTGVTAYVYDETGNVVQKTDVNGVTVQYIYDDLNRLTNVNFPDAAQNITYSYDGGTNGIGRLTGVVDEAGSTAFEYDGRGRLVKKISHILGIDYQVFRSLTPGGLLSTITYPSGRTIDYTRHATGKIQSVATTAASVTTTLIDNPVYGAFGRPLSMTTGSGATVNNQTGECDCLEVSNPGAPMEQVYAYDGNRNVTAITGTQKPWLNQTFSYDALNRSGVLSRQVKKAQMRPLTKAAAQIGEWEQQQQGALLACQSQAESVPAVNPRKRRLKDFFFSRLFCVVPPLPK